MSWRKQNVILLKMVCTVYSEVKDILFHSVQIINYVKEKCMLHYHQIISVSFIFTWVRYNIIIFLYLFLPYSLQRVIKEERILIILLKNLQKIFKHQWYVLKRYCFFEYNNDILNEQVSQPKNYRGYYRKEINLTHFTKLTSLIVSFFFLFVDKFYVYI